MGTHDRIVAAITAGDAMELGRVLEIAGAGAKVSLDGHMMGMVRKANGLGAPPGSIGSHVKIRVNNRWVLGQIRSLHLAQADSDLVMGTIAFVGKGSDANARLGTSLASKQY